MTLSFLPLPPDQISSHATESIPSGETYLNSPLGASTRQPRCLVTSCSKEPQVLGSTEPLSTPSRLGLYSCPAFLIASSELISLRSHRLSLSLSLSSRRFLTAHCYVQTFAAFLPPFELTK